MKQAIVILVALVFAVEGKLDRLENTEQKHCLVEHLDLEAISGTWFTEYYDNAKQTPYEIDLTKVNSETILLVNKSRLVDGKLVENDEFSLTFVPGFGDMGFMEHVMQIGDTTHHHPYYWLAVDPKRYMAIYFYHKDHTVSYAIFVRELGLSKDFYEKAMQGFVCTKKNPKVHLLNPDPQFTAAVAASAAAAAAAASAAASAVAANF